MGKIKMGKYHGVARGMNPGIYQSLSEVEAQTIGYKDTLGGAKVKECRTLKEAEDYIQDIQWNGQFKSKLDLDITRGKRVVTQNRVKVKSAYHQSKNHFQEKNCNF